MKASIEFDTVTHVVSVSVDGNLATQIHDVSTQQWFETPARVWIKQATRSLAST